MRARGAASRAGLGLEAPHVASGVLDEFAVDELVRSGAPIDIYAVGARIEVSADAPNLDSAYKMVEYDGRPVMKLSSAKVTAPGSKQAFRRPGYADVIGLADEQPPPGNGRRLLETVMRSGKRTGGRPRTTRARRGSPSTWPSCPRQPAGSGLPYPPHATASEQLSELADRVRRRIEEEVLLPSTAPDPVRTASGGAEAGRRRRQPRR